MFASFVGVVATTLVFASFGLVAVSSSVATGAAAGAVLCFTPCCASVPSHSVDLPAYMQATYHHISLGLAERHVPYMTH